MSDSYPSFVALIYYDYFLTLPREITYIWQRPFHILTVLYFFCRYSLLSNVIYGAGLYEKFIGARVSTLRLSSLILKADMYLAYLISVCG